MQDASETDRDGRPAGCRKRKASKDAGRAAGSEDYNRGRNGQAIAEQWLLPIIKEDFMNTTKLLAPIVCETRVRVLDGEDLCIKNHRHGDTYNLTTGEVHVARMIGGVRYDTTNASLVVGFGEYFGYCCYTLSRLYRTNDGKFFLLQMQWAADVGLIGMKAIDEVHDVLTVAKNILLESQTAEFLREWYCSGLLPLDDEFVRDWAESVLPADECEAVLAALAGRYSPRHSADAADAEGSTRTS